MDRPGTGVREGMGRWRRGEASTKGHEGHEEEGGATDLANARFWFSSAFIAPVRRRFIGG